MMTLLDAPRFDEVADRRKRLIVWSSVAAFTLAVILIWISAGFPVDWPWNWLTHMRGRATINAFLKDVEHNDLNAAYIVWTHDKDWQQQLAQFQAHPFAQFQQEKGSAMDQKALVKAYGELVHDKDWQRHQDMLSSYPLSKFEEDWSPTSPDNDYGAVKSHQIAAGRMNGNVLVVGIFVNGSRAKPLFLAYDPKTKTLAFSPVELYLGP
ncbi:MAG TPA: hypothetical protein VMD29_06380 [Terracidiphilus sp.]|nr:hypothetical protein [Terracidiphilus sp.]